jgi:hypothetical protein
MNVQHQFLPAHTQAARPSAGAPAQQVRCSRCGRTAPYLTWVPGGYWKHAWLACDECYRDHAASSLSGILIDAGIVLAPFILVALWFVVAFAQAFLQALANAH